MPLLLSAGMLVCAAAHAETAFLACDGCHGTNGISQASHIPTISGLNFQYFYAAMQDFRKDRRNSTIMGRVAKGYKSGQLQRMALHYGTRRWQGNPQQKFDPALAQRGRELHENNCIECHEQNGHFQDRETPPLAGQAKGYLLNQMRIYQVAANIMPQPPMMQEQLEGMSEQDLLALAEFFSSSLARAQAGPGEK